MDRSQAHWDAADRMIERELGRDAAAEIRRLRDVDAARQALADAVEPLELDAATVAHLKSIGTVAAALDAIAECGKDSAA